MFSIYNFNNIIINGNNVTINGQQIPTKNDEITLEGALQAIGNPTAEDRVNTRISLGDERRRIREEEAAQRLKRKQKEVSKADRDKADVDEESEDSVDLDEKDETEADANLPRVTAWILRKAAKEVAKTEDESIILYENGYAIYTSVTGDETVLWVPGLKDIDFTKMKERPEYDLHIEDLNGEAWYVAIMVVGDYQINENGSKQMVNKMRDNGLKGQKVADDESDGDDDGSDSSDDEEKYSRGPYRPENTETAYLKMEAFTLFMEKLNDMQRNVMIAYHVLGFALEEIADAMDRDRSTVKYHYERAEERIGNTGVKFLENASNLEGYCGAYLDETFHARLLYNQQVKGCRQRRPGKLSKKS